MNRLTKWGFLAFLFAVSGCVFQDDASFGPDEIFVKYYGSSAEERAVDLVELKKSSGESEYLILGTREVDAANTDYVLIKTDYLGERLWEASYSAVIESTEVVEDALVTVVTEVGTLDVPVSLTLFDCIDDKDCNKVMIAGASTIDNATYALIVGVDLNSEGVEYGQLRYQYYANDYDLENGTGAFINTTCSKIIPYQEDIGLGFLMVGSVEITRISDVTGGRSDRSSTLMSKIESGVFNTTFDTSKKLIEDDTILSIVSYSDKLGSNYVRDDIFTYEERSDFDGEEFGVDLVKVESNGNTLASEAKYFLLGYGNSGTSGGFDIIIFDVEGANGTLDNSAFGGSSDEDNIAEKIMYDGGSRLRVVGTSVSGVNQSAFELNIDLDLQGSSYNKLDFPIGGTSEENWDTSGSDIVRSAFGDLFVLGQVLDYKDEDDLLKGSEILLIPGDGQSKIILDEVQVMGGIGDDEGKAMIMREDGSIVIAATTDFGGGALMISLIKTNSKGELLAE